MQRVLQETRTFDLNKQVVKEFLRIKFFQRKVGRDMFLGNCAGSCTSLGSNASAAFQFILDQGTMYAVIENQKGEVKGYARFFLGIGSDDKPLFFIDSIDGKAAWDHVAKMKGQINALAESIGLGKGRVYDRQTNVVNKKLGGVLLEGYFHHAGSITLDVSNNNTESLDNQWQPDGGWQVVKKEDRDRAMVIDEGIIKNSDPGGIDLTATKVNLQTQNSGGEIHFHINPAMLKQLQNAPGFVPVIINVQPCKSLQEFLGVNTIQVTDLQNHK